MSKFDVGTKVASYSVLGREVGFVKEITERGHLKLLVNRGTTWTLSHPKQCYLLTKKKKKKRRK